MGISDSLANIFDASNPLFWVLLLTLLSLVLFKVLKPFVFMSRFVYPNAKFAGIGNPFITRHGVERMVEAKDLGEYRTLLNQVRGYSLKGEDAKTLQRELNAKLFASFSEAKKDSPKSINGVFEIFARIFDTPVVERFVRAALAERKIELPERMFLPENMELVTRLMEATPEEVPAILVKNGLADEGSEAFKDGFDELLFSAELEKKIIMKLERYAVPKPCKKPLQKFIKQYSDIQNIKNMLRAKQLGLDADYSKKLLLREGWELLDWRLVQLSEVDSVSEVITQLEATSYIKPLRDAIIDYEKEASLRPLEKALDQHLISMTARLSIDYNLNVGPLLRYLVSHMYEIQNLKSLAKGIEERVDGERLRDIMVMEVSAA